MKEGLVALVPLLGTILSVLGILPFSPMYPIAAVLFGLIVLSCALYCRCVFDMSTRTIAWKKIGLMKRESGACSFEEVKELAIDFIATTDSPNGKNYRIVLRLDNKDVPLTDTYQYMLGKTENRVKQISDFTAIKIAKELICIETKYIKEVVELPERKK
ncbi:MAG: hypothetical protein SFY67_07270 [Candidatus Melainabacteria bacterium]|nr:hypothetical protein [Candidatus Melainabacteria bacterium]